MATKINKETYDEKVETVLAYSRGERSKLAEKEAGAGSSPSATDPCGEGAGAATGTDTSQPFAKKRKAVTSKAVTPVASEHPGYRDDFSDIDDFPDIESQAVVGEVPDTDEHSDETIGSHSDPAVIVPDQPVDGEELYTDEHSDETIGGTEPTVVVRPMYITPDGGGARHDGAIREILDELAERGVDIKSLAPMYDAVGERGMYGGAKIPTSQRYTGALHKELAPEFAYLLPRVKQDDQTIAAFVSSMVAAAVAASAAGGGGGFPDSPKRKAPQGRPYVGPRHSVAVNLGVVRAEFTKHMRRLNSKRAYKKGTGSPLRWVLLSELATAFGFAAPTKDGDVTGAFVCHQNPDSLNASGDEVFAFHVLGNYCFCKGHLKFIQTVLQLAKGEL